MCKCTKVFTHTHKHKYRFITVLARSKRTLLQFYCKYVCTHRCVCVAYNSILATSWLAIELPCTPPPPTNDFTFSHVHKLICIAASHCSVILQQKPLRIYLFMLVLSQALHQCNSVCVCVCVFSVY